MNDQNETNRRDIPWVDRGAGGADPYGRMEELLFLNAHEESSLWNMANEIWPSDATDTSGADQLNRIRELLKQHLAEGHVRLYRRVDDVAEDVPEAAAFALLNSPKAWEPPREFNDQIFLSLTRSGLSFLARVGRRSE